MEVLSEEDYKKIYYGLLGIPTIDERDFALPVARKLVIAYQAGKLLMTQKQIDCLIRCIGTDMEAKSK